MSTLLSHRKMHFNISKHCNSSVLAATHMKFHQRTTNKPRKPVDKLLEWLNCTEPTVPSFLVRLCNHKLICQNIFRCFNNYRILSKCAKKSIEIQCDSNIV